MDDIPQPEAYSPLFGSAKKGGLPMQVSFDGLCQRIEAGFADVPEHEGMNRIDALVADERRQHRIDTGD